MPSFWLHNYIDLASILMWYELSRVLQEALLPSFSQQSHLQGVERGIKDTSAEPNTTAQHAPKFVRSDNTIMFTVDSILGHGAVRFANVFIIPAVDWFCESLSQSRISPLSTTDVDWLCK